tara:strand:- start:10533 stop:11270 length:738 start_codon:yes stop_codon:yes gene_type:complete
MSAGRLVKTVKFNTPNYIGDPLNVIRIFNDKYVDELVIIDIGSTKNKTEPNYSLLEKIAKEAFMPMTYGGGIKSLEMISKIFKIGFEKVIINSEAIINPNIIKEASNYFGSQSIIAGIDVKLNKNDEYKVYDYLIRKETNLNPIEYALELERYGAGEILVYSVDQDGVMNGYDLKLTQQISKSIQIPLIALGGAGKTINLVEVIEDAGASAAGAGSLFIYRMPHKAVLISYPTRKDLEELVNNFK